MRSVSILAAALAIVIASSTSYARAQNSLGTGYPPTVSAIDRLSAPQSASAVPAPLRYDNQVVRTGYDQAPSENAKSREGWTTDDIRAIAKLSSAATQGDSPRPNFIQREKELTGSTGASTDAMPKKQNFGKLIANIGMNLAFVLLVGIGFIVISKQWFNPKANNKKNKTEEDISNSLLVKEKLDLDGKSTMRVIQWKDFEILVASGAEGVQAMIPLTPTFSETFDQVETEFGDREIEPQRVETRRSETQSQSSRFSARSPAISESNPAGIDDKLIQMLLDSANRSAESKSAASSSYSAKVKRA